ncbi:MAG: P-loop NTPase [candidate division Zixibacteria bacterium]|nr:P-loop NTPase [candidate division Zixibacteria bacterium]
MADENKPKSEEEEIAETFEKNIAEASQQSMENEALDKRMSQIKKKIVVLSGKGGVGKSTVAANLATSLALAGKKVGLMDIDIHGPSIPKLMGLESEPITGTDDSIHPIKKSDNLSVMSVGFLMMNTDDPVIWRGPLKYSLIRQFLRDVEWGELDYLIIDSPPGTGDEPLSVVQLLSNNLDGAVIVTTPQQLAIDDVRKSIGFCRKVELPILGVVENMAGFICPHCGEKTELFKSHGGSDMAESMGVKFLGSIPIDPQIVESSDLGVDYLRNYPEREAAKAFKSVIETIQNS